MCTDMHFTCPEPAVQDGKKVHLHLHLHLPPQPLTVDGWYSLSHRPQYGARLLRSLS